MDRALDVDLNHAQPFQLLEIDFKRLARTGELPPSRDSLHKLDSRTGNWSDRPADRNQRYDTDRLLHHGVMVSHIGCGLLRKGPTTAGSARLTTPRCNLLLTNQPC